MTKILNSEPSADFIVEIDRARGVTYYTPNSPAAHEWSHGTPPGSEYPRKGNLAGTTVLIGRSFVLKNDNPRASKLRGYLKSDKLAEQRSVAGQEPAAPFVVVVKTIS